ncbi:MAG: hypothetical protein JEZ07_13255 [Phycisphaerae bacterium]|nr:hypothetical protein [Phycisphaerae bacterium]
MSEFIDKNIKEPFARLERDKGFIKALVIMLVLAVGFQAGLAALKVNLVKEAIPLQNSLDFLDEEALLPYFVPELLDRNGKDVAKQKIDNKDMEDELGTTDYIIWYLEDPEPAIDAISMANLFITYYTGDAGKVPHIPNACYMASGAEPIGDYVKELTISGSDGKEYKVPVNILYFRHKGIDGAPDTISSIVYFFKANGQYAAGRNGVRILTHNWRDKYAYFSKVEIKFIGKRSASTAKVEPEQLEAATKKLLVKLLPELEKSHWPVWPPQESEEQEQK